jgi:hypothetical protein
MKKLGLVALLALVAVAPGAFASKPTFWTPQSTAITQVSASCIRYCRDVCIANGETCAICGPNCCACN